MFELSDFLQPQSSPPSSSCQPSISSAVQRQRLKRNEPPDVAIRLSVVMPTYRRPDLLKRCLSALAAQTLDPRLYEIVVVDDGGSLETWKTVRAVASAAPMPAIRYLATHSRRGPAAARNLGWRASRGDIIAFTDDDCIPCSDWLTEGYAIFHDPAVSGSWGRIVVPLPEQPTDHDLNTKGLERSPCATANCFYKRTALASVGGFDERFTAAWREDSDLQFTLLERGGRLLPCERAVVVHPARPAPWGISLRQQRNNLFNALLFKKHPGLYRTLQPHPPWRYYATVGALSVAVGATTVAPSPLWAVGGAAIWTGLTADFCRRRLKNTSRHPRHMAEMAITSVLIPPSAIFWRLLGALRYRTPFL